MINLFSSRETQQDLSPPSSPSLIPSNSFLKPIKSNAQLIYEDFSNETTLDDQLPLLNNYTQYYQSNSSQIIPDYLNLHCDSIFTNNRAIQVSCENLAVNDQIKFKDILYQLIHRYNINLNATSLHDIISSEIGLRETNDDEKNDELVYFANFFDYRNEIIDLIRNNQEKFGT